MTTRYDYPANQWERAVLDHERYLFTLLPGEPISDKAWLYVYEASGLQHSNGEQVIWRAAQFPMTPDKPTRRVLKMINMNNHMCPEPGLRIRLNHDCIRQYLRQYHPLIDKEFPHDN